MSAPGGNADLGGERRDEDVIDMDELEEAEAAATTAATSVRDGTIKSMLEAGCPPKRRKKQTALTVDEAEDTADQANLRIHIERAYARTKQFRFLAGEVRINQVDIVGKIFSVVSLCSIPIVVIWHTQDLLLT